MGYRPDKRQAPEVGHHREPVSSTECLECGHLITDHHKAGGGWHNGASEKWKASAVRDHCIGNRDTCPCRKFVQPHTFTRTSVVMGG